MLNLIHINININININFYLYYLLAKFITLIVANYGIIKDEDFHSSCNIYKEIKNIDFFKNDQISYNLYYNGEFINSSFKNLYLILEEVDDGVLIVDKKNFKYLKFEDVVKFIFHIKVKLIRPMIEDLFGM